MKMTIRVDIGQGPYEVTTNLRTVIQWERKYKAKISNGVGIEDIAFMAYEASKAAGVTVPAVFDDFVNRAIELEVVSAGDTGPTLEELSAGS